jgi:membrane protein implicated in regulation of membrane protease activity
MIGWIATILCIIGNSLVIAKKNGFLVWFIGTGLLLILALLRQDWSQAFLFLIYEGLNVFGFIKWYRGSKKKKNKHILN